MKKKKNEKEEQWKVFGFIIVSTLIDKSYWNFQEKQFSRFLLQFLVVNQAEEIFTVLSYAQMVLRNP